MDIQIRSCLSAGQRKGNSRESGVGIILSPRTSGSGKGVVGGSGAGSS